MSLETKELNAKNNNLLCRSFQSHLPLFVQQQQQEQVPYSKESAGKISCCKNHYRFSSCTVNATLKKVNKKNTTTNLTNPYFISVTFRKWTNRLFIILSCASV